MNSTTVRLLLAWYEAEEEVLAATRAARAAGFQIHDVFTPYAVHGMDEAMGLKPSRLTWVCFAMGLLGLFLALLLQTWTSAIDWPLIVGGKPFNSFPAFIPVAFELTVLSAGLGTVAALFFRARLLPRPRPEIALAGVTRDRFVLALLASGAGFDTETARALLMTHGATETDVIEAATRGGG